MTTHRVDIQTNPQRRVARPPGHAVKLPTHPGRSRYSTSQALPGRAVPSHADQPRPPLARTLHDTLDTTYVATLGGRDADRTSWDDCHPAYRDAVRAAIDAIEPLIRADERAASTIRELAAEIRALTRLRAQVEALEVRQPWGPSGTDMVALDEVLALIDGTERP